MYCKECGKQLGTDAKFCNNCGAKTETEIKIESEQVLFKTGDEISEDLKTEIIESNETNFIPPEDNRTIFEKGLLKSFWNSKWFSWASIMFSRFINYIGIFMGIFMISVSGFGGSSAWLFVIAGLLTSLTSAGNVYLVHMRKRKRSYTNCSKCSEEVKIGTQFCPKCGEAILVQTIEKDNIEDAGNEAGIDGASLKKKKWVLIQATLVASVLIIFFVFSNGSDYFGPVGNVRDIVFDDFGVTNIGTVIDRTFSEPEWSHEEITDDVSRVFVTGYLSLFRENVRVEFIYEDKGDMYSVSVEEIRLLYSGETYSDNIDINIFLSMLYEEASYTSPVVNESVETPEYELPATNTTNLSAQEFWNAYEGCIFSGQGTVQDISANNDGSATGTLSLYNYGGPDESNIIIDFYIPSDVYAGYPDGFYQFELSNYYPEDTDDDGYYDRLIVNEYFASDFLYEVMPMMATRLR